MRLVDPATGNELLSLSTDTEDVGRLLSLDVGFPAVRSVTTFRSKTHGALDSTRYLGDRAITAVLQMPVDSDAAVDTLAGLLNPQLRLWLYVRRDGWDAERRILVRGAMFSCPPGANRQAQAGWVAPAGLFEDSVLSQLILSPAGTAEGGLSFTFTYPKTYGTGVVPGYAYAQVGGTISAAPQIDVYGPCTSPSIELVGTGQNIVFTGLTVADGNFLRVDLSARTVYLNGDPTLSEYSALDFTVSSWWALPPGQQQLLFSPLNAGPGCVAVVSWRNRTIAG